MSVEHPSTVSDAPLPSGPSTEKKQLWDARRFVHELLTGGWRAWAQRVLDLAIAAGCASVDIEVRSAFTTGEIYGLLPQASYGWLAVVSATLLLARRRWPVGVTALVTGSLLLGTGSVLTVVVAYFSLARHTRALRTVYVSGAAGCAVILGVAALHLRLFAPRHEIPAAAVVPVLAFVALASVVLPVVAGLYPRVPRQPWWWEHRRAMLFDVLLVLLFELVSLVVWLVGAQQPGEEDLPWLPVSAAMVLVVLQGLALIWRRRYPTVVAAVCIAVFPFVFPAPTVLPVGLYTLAKYGRSRRNLGLACTAAVLMLTAWSAYAQRHSPGQFIPTVVFLVVPSVAVPVLLGMYRGTRHSLVLSLRERAERLEREQHLLATQARMQERARIAREMHDIVSHRVSLMVVHAGALEAGAAGENQVAIDTGKLMGQMGRQALNELRQVLGVLRESDGSDQAPLTPQPTLDEVAVLVEESRAAGAPVTFEIAGDAARVAPSVQAAVYRLVQEGLTNARKHAAHASVRVTLRHLPGILKVVIDNDPPTQPAPAPLPSGGHGLTGLSERVSMLGGTVDWTAREDGGFRVTATFPVPDEPQC